MTKGSLTKGKGKGKQKGKKTGYLAIEDGAVEDDEEEEDENEKTEAEEWKDSLSKAKRARDQSTSHMADCQAALELADKAKRLTKTGKAESEELLKGIGKKPTNSRTFWQKRKSGAAWQKQSNCLWMLQKK